VCSARLFLALLFVALCATHALAQPPTRVGLVVSLGDGAVETRCVDLREGKVSGYDLLVDSGLEVQVEFTGGGIKVCSIAGQGCPAENCWCKCQGGECTYWSYWHLVDGAWVYSPIGAAAYTVQPGSVEGWSWGEEPPPVFTLEQICAPPASTPTQTPEPTATATATQTPAPTGGTDVPPTATPVPPTATAAATPTLETSQSAENTPTAALTETPEPTATTLPPTTTAIPTYTPLPSPDAPKGPSATNYVIFGGIVVVLVVVGLVIKKR
jgi:hypothetical protein